MRLPRQVQRLYTTSVNQCCSENHILKQLSGVQSEIEKGIEESQHQLEVLERVLEAAFWSDAGIYLKLALHSPHWYPGRY